MRHHGAAQALDDLAGKRAIGLARRQRHQHLTVLVAIQGFGFGELEPGEGGHGAHLGRIELLADGVGHLVGLTQRALQRHAGGHVHVHIKQAHRIEGEKLLLDHATGHHRAGTDHGQQDHQQRQLGPAHHTDQRARVAQPHPMRKTHPTRLAGTLASAGFGADAQHVGGQDPEGFKQTDAERHGDHKGHDKHELAENARQQHQR